MPLIMDKTFSSIFLVLGLVLCICAPQQLHSIDVQEKSSQALTATTVCCLCNDSDPDVNKRCSRPEFSCTGSFNYCAEYCVTHKYFVNNTWSLSKRCGKQTECEINWYKTASKPECFSDEKPAENTVCFFCCRSPDKMRPGFCRGPDISNFYTFPPRATGPTTTSITMNATTTGTMPTTIRAATPMITSNTTTNTTRGTNVRSCEVCRSDNGLDCAHKTIMHCNTHEPYCMNEITSTTVKKISKRCATEGECYRDWWLTTKQNPNCQGNVTGTGVCHYCCETLEGSETPCNTQAIPTDLKSYAIPESKCQIGTGIRTDQFKEEICPRSAPFCLNTVSLDQHSSTELVRKRCAEEIECLSDWWNNTRSRPECLHANGTLLNIHANLHGEACHYCCFSNGTTTPCNINNIPDQSLLLNFTTANIIPESTKSYTTASAYRSSTVNSVTIAPPEPEKTSVSQVATKTTLAASKESTKGSITTTWHQPSTVKSVTIAPPEPTKGSITTTGHQPSTVNSVTIAPPEPEKASVSQVATKTTLAASKEPTKSNTTTSAYQSSTAKSVTIAPPGEPFNCYVCPYGGNYFVPVSQECPDNQHFCLNTIEDKRDGTRVMEKRCATENECFQKWWQESSDQEVCKKLYELGDAPSRQDLLCHFCCTEDYCNYFTTPDKSQLYDGNGHHP